MTYVDEDQIIDQIQNKGYKLTLYNTQEDDLFICISATKDGDIKLYLKVPVSDMHSVFEQSYWQSFDKATDNIQCMFCKNEEKVRGIWTVSKHDLEFISHEECIEQLELDIRTLSDKHSVDIVSRL